MITRPQPYRLDFSASGDLLTAEKQIGVITESADQMFQTLFQDLGAVEQSIATGGLTAVVVAAMITAAIAAIPPYVPPTHVGHYSVLTNGYLPAPELVFALGDVIEVWVP